MNSLSNKLNLSTVCWSIFPLWVGIQIYLLICNWNLPAHDDALLYQTLALRCIENVSWYPFAGNLYDEYIFGPGYVNLLIGVYRLTGTFASVCILNLLLNIFLLFEIFVLGKRLFGEKVAYISVLLYMCMYSNAYMPIAPLTDLPFTFLLLSALLLGMDKRLLPVMAAGVLLALANWFRPLAVVYLITLLVYYVVHKRRWSSYAALLIPLVLCVCLIGLSTKNRMGYFVYQSTTGGVNLAMSASDKATGTINFAGLLDSSTSVYLPPSQSYTFADRDRLLKEGSIEWISKHPVKYVSLFPVKIALLFCEDTWPERVKPGMGFGTILPQIKGDKVALVELGVTVFMKSLVYYLALFFFMYYLWKNRRRLFKVENIFLLIPLLGTAMTIVVVVTSRYHYPYLFMITIYAASGVVCFMESIYKKYR